MKCFPFPYKNPKTNKSNVADNSSASAFTEDDARKSSSDGSNASSSAKISISSLSQRSTSLKVFTFEELKVATKNFARSLMLGEGGFGPVYRGVLKDSNLPIDVAVKRLSTRGLQGHKEWVTEVNLLGVAQHPNLVKLIGYCAEDDDELGIQRLLVYEYLPNKSVQDHISNRFLRTPLPWAVRLRVARDAASGLAYLHQGMEFQIIFRDFKSSNILLDDRWNAKLSDFGLARLGPVDGLGHVSTAVVGTVGYAAPEYMKTGRITSKSDVWSYGVFVYELITGRRPFDGNRPKNERKLLDWVRTNLSSSAKRFEGILDWRLEGAYDLRSAQKLAAIANKCLAKHPKDRPRMSEVVEVIDRVVVGLCHGRSVSPSPDFIGSGFRAEGEEEEEEWTAEIGSGRRWLNRVIGGDGRCIGCRAVK